MSVVWSLTGTTVTDTTLYMFHTVNGCIMRVYWFYSLLSFSVVHSSSFFLAFITVAVVCVMDLVVWNKRGLDWIGYILTTLFTHCSYAYNSQTSKGSQATPRIEPLETIT